ncbi:nitroreductase family protein [Georgenia deserti]|uniref:Nitroreductase family protein n=1 Tax=Georgenia deserti TaxID=2093781 RepID=A0ABW4L2F5_9MICO
MLQKLKKTVKDVLAVPAVRKAYEAGNRAVLGAVGSNRLAATLYSFPGFATFNREQYAVLAGRRAYYAHLNQARPTHVELRRNIHRLEKGILMQPRRDVFARDYIEETVDFYLVAVRGRTEGATQSIDEVELRWAHDVLRTYFTLVRPGDAAVDRARTTFEAAPVPGPVAPEATIRPYPHGSIERSDVTYDQLLALARQRRSVRWFLDKPVPRDLIDKALVVGREAPTACNRLPYEYLVYDDPELVRKVAAIPFGTGGYAHQIPTIVVVKGRLDSYFSPRDRHAIYIDAALATMGFVLALETLGLSSSIINWPDFEPLELKMQKTLGLEVHDRVVCLIAVGYPQPESLVASSPKKSLEVLRSYNAVPE